MAYNPSMANKGMGFEQEILNACKTYKRIKMANIQKISTPWKVIRKGTRIVNAFPEGKSTLDFRGTVRMPKGRGLPISFDCKETTKDKGLKLSNIAVHQIEYMRNAIEVGEVTFILVKFMTDGTIYYAPGQLVLAKWDLWQMNKGKRGFSWIDKGVMTPIQRGKHININFLSPVFCTTEAEAIKMR